MTLGKLWHCCLGLATLFLGLAALLLIGCSSDNKNQNFSYHRTPAYFKAEIAKSDHPFCADFSSAFDTEADCIKAKKYRLSWLRPEDTDHFEGYRIYVDTVPPNAPSGRKWADVQNNSSLANIIVQTTDATDSIIFVFGSREFQQDTLQKNSHRIFVIDTTNRQEIESGRLVFALVPVYSGGVTPGQPQLSWFIINDKFPPNVFDPSIKPQAKAIDIAWQRPNDLTSFFDASLDTGFIRNYGLQITLGGRLTTARKKAFIPKITFFVGGKDVSSLIRDSLIIESNDSIPKGHAYFLPDSNHARKARAEAQDSLRAVISNLTPQDTLVLQLWAVDSLGNSNRPAVENIVVHLTDTTQPSPPLLSADSAKIHNNDFVIQWKASSDSVGLDGGGKAAGPEPNYQIEEYRLSRTLVRDSGEKVSLLDRLDTIIQVGPGNKATPVFLDTMRFLPPGRAFKLRLFSVDVTGFESAVESLTVKTPNVRFTDSDSSLTCPTGFIPIPRGEFNLGESGTSAQPDEAPSRPVKMAPYCIEPYEHRDDEGRFVTNVSWQQADSICRGLGVDPSYAPQLCSEAEWERACEGPGLGPDSALAHGIQSEQKNASILQSTCNQGTNDSVMARSFDLRSIACLTKEGVYDLAGNYSEWVRDPYVASAYSTISAGESLSHGFTFADSGAAQSGSGIRRGFRGGNFLKPPNLSLSTIQGLARCSNRDFAQQVRPQFRSDCLDSAGPKIAVIYGPGLANHFCMDIPAPISKSKITDLTPDARDTSGTSILAFLEGKTEPYAFKLERPQGDSTFKSRKPLAVRLTTRSLAIVSFVKPGLDSAIPDTLDATEMRDTSQAILNKIFSREAGNSGWTVKQEGGRFAIRYLYANVETGTKPAKPYYSSRAIAFRCCSLAKSQPAPAVPLAASP